MSKIFVVTSGCYSSYSICGVYSTKERAETIIQHVCDSRIEEYELDEFYNEIERGLRPFQVTFIGEEVTVIGQKDLSMEFDTVYQNANDKGPRFYIPVIAQDAAHAVKIAAEKRMQALVEIEQGLWEKTHFGWERKY